MHLQLTNTAKNTLLGQEGLGLAGLGWGLSHGVGLPPRAGGALGRGGGDAWSGRDRFLF